MTARAAAAMSVNRGANVARKFVNFGQTTHVVCARNKVLGRLSSDIAKILIGKHKPMYDPSVMMGDHVVILNCKEIAVTGKKFEQKLYRRHSGYTGNLKETALKDLHTAKPTEALRLSIRGMLPKNKLRDRIMAQRLILYEGERELEDTETV